MKKIIKMNKGKIMKTNIYAAVFLCLLFSFNSIFPQTEEKKKELDNAEKIKLLDDKISVLEEAIEARKMKNSVKKYDSVEGMGPAASSVYAAEGFSFGGYAEVVGAYYKSDYRKSTADAQRLILYMGYHFNDWIVFNSEIEYEHGGFERTEVVTDVNFAERSVKKSEIEKGKVSVEFAYLDFLFNDAFQLRTGLNLVPIGMTNYMHEPTTFYSVQRPLTETTIIPTTWRELGVFAQGSFAGKKYQYKTGIMSGLDAAGFTEESWIGEDGSYRGSKAELVNPAFILNLEAKPWNGFLAGVSYYAGGSGQGNIFEVSDEERLIRPALLPGFRDEQIASDIETVNNADKKRTSALIQIGEGHFSFKGKYAELRGLYARGWMSENDARSINRFTGENIGITAEGGYLEAAFNLLAFVKTGHKLMFFIRDERLNTQKSTVERKPAGREDQLDYLCASVDFCRTTDLLPEGNLSLGIVENQDPYREMYGVRGTANRVNDRTVITTGLAYFPHPNVVLKIEYAMNNSKSDYHRDIELFNPDNNKIDQINFGLGVIW